MSKRQMKSIPEIENEDDERDFWSRHDSTEFVDWDSAKSLALTRLQPSTQSISLRLPLAMLEELKLEAHKRDIPYQSLLKVFLAERLAHDREMTR